MIREASGPEELLVAFALSGLAGPCASLLQAVDNVRSRKTAVTARVCDFLGAHAARVLNPEPSQSGTRAACAPRVAKTQIRSVSIRLIRLIRDLFSQRRSRK